MPHRWRPRPPEDLSVAAVEQILSVAAARSAGPVSVRDGRAVVDRAVWFCACVTLEDAPIWVIYDTEDGNFGWRRVPDDLTPDSTAIHELGRQIRQLQSD